MLAAGLGYNYRSVVLDWALSAPLSQAVLADAGTAHEVHGVEYEDVYGNSAHSHFSLGEFTVPADEPAESEPAQPLPRPFGIEGAWTTNMMAESEAGQLTRNNCTYSLTGLNLTLKESAGEIHGSGDYSLRARECTTGLTAVSAYVVATGFFNPPYVKLSMLEDEGGEPLFVFYGTTRPEGILGQVRTTDGRLLAEHVSLNAPAK